MQVSPVGVAASALELVPVLSVEAWVAFGRIAAVENSTTLRWPATPLTPRAAC